MSITDQRLPGAIFAGGERTSTCQLISYNEADCVRDFELAMLKTTN